jgi:hypothetical protein
MYEDKALDGMNHEERRREVRPAGWDRAGIFCLLLIGMATWLDAGLAPARGKDGRMAGEDWPRLADYVVARRVELGMRDRRAFAAATGVTERTLGKLENGQHVSPSTLGMVENRLGWIPGSCRHVLAGGEPKVGTPDLGHEEREDPTLWHIASTPGLPPDVVRGLVALARNWRQGDNGPDEQTR